MSGWGWRWDVFRTTIVFVFFDKITQIKRELLKRKNVILNIIPFLHRRLEKNGTLWPLRAGNVIRLMCADWLSRKRDGPFFPLVIGRLGPSIRKTWGLKATLSNYICEKFEVCAVFYFIAHVCVTQGNVSRIIHEIIHAVIHDTCKHRFGHPGSFDQKAL